MRQRWHAPLRRTSIFFFFSAALTISGFGTFKLNVWKWDAGMFIGVFPVVRDFLGFLVGPESDGIS